MVGQLEALFQRQSERGVLATNAAIDGWRVLHTWRDRLNLQY
jgi:hypothetical protein